MLLYMFGVKKLWLCLIYEYKYIYAGHLFVTSSVVNSFISQYNSPLGQALIKCEQTRPDHLILHSKLVLTWKLEGMDLVLDLTLCLLSVFWFLRAGWLLLQLGCVLSDLMSQQVLRSENRCSFIPTNHQTSNPDCSDHNFWISKVIKGHHKNLLW